MSPFCLKLNYPLRLANHIFGMRLQNGDVSRFSLLASSKAGRLLMYSCRRKSSSHVGFNWQFLLTADYLRDYDYLRLRMVHSSMTAEDYLDLVCGKILARLSHQHLPISLPPCPVILLLFYSAAVFSGTLLPVNLGWKPLPYETGLGACGDAKASGEQMVYFVMVSLTLLVRGALPNPLRPCLIYWSI